jgi:hypothetical protein
MLRRLAWCAAPTVLTAALLLPTIAQADDLPGAPPGNLGDFNTFGHSWQIFLTSVLQPQLNAILTGTTDGGVSYVTWANGALGTGYLVTSLIALYRWVFRDESAVSLVTVVVKGGIITLIYASYSTLTSFLFGAAYELSFLIQQQALGDSTLMGPAAFIVKALSAIDLGSTSLFSLTITGLFLAAGFLALEAVLVIASVFVAAWPTLLYVVATIIGPVMFPFLFVEQLSFLFDGWLRLFFASLFYLLIGRVVLIVIALLIGSFFGVPYSTSPQVAPIVLDTSSIANVAILFILSFISLFMLFYSGSFVSQIVGGGNLSLSNGIGKAAVFAARFFL